MKRAVTALLAAASASLMFTAGSAWAIGSDIIFDKVQAQVHPNQANTEPFAVAQGVALGEVYYQPGSGYGYRAHESDNSTCRVEASLCSR
jgi:hypothetical protein